MTDVIVVSRVDVEPKIERPRPHKVILLNDDYTSREFVVTILKAEFKAGAERARMIMLTAHRLGSCVIAIYPQDVAETKAARATEAGKSKGYPLQFVTEPEQ